MMRTVNQKKVTKFTWLSTTLISVDIFSKIAIASTSVPLYVPAYSRIVISLSTGVASGPTICDEVILLLLYVLVC